MDKLTVEVIQAVHDINWDILMGLFERDSAYEEEEEIPLLTLEYVGGRSSYEVKVRYCGMHLWDNEVDQRCYILNERGEEIEGEDGECLRESMWDFFMRSMKEKLKLIIVGLKVLEDE